MDQKENIGKYLRVPGQGIMPKPNLNFSRGLNGTITTMLGSTQLTHPNAKTLQASLFVPNPQGPKINDATQKFPKKQLHDGLDTFFTKPKHWVKVRTS